MFAENSVEFGRIVLEQRRAQQMTQKELAAKVGTTQPQVSQLENGRGDVIAQSIVAKILEVLKLDPRVVGSGPSTDTEQKCGICTNSECPGGMVGLVGTAVVLRPKMWRIRDMGGDRPKCVICGEIIIHLCSNCNAEIKPGMFCSACGKPLVAPPSAFATLHRSKWAAQIEEINKRNSAFSAHLGFEDLPYL